MSNIEKRHLIFLLGLALLLRLFVFFTTPVIGTDGYNWFHAARCFAEGDFEAGLKHPIHPVYPVLFAMLAKLVGDYELAGKAVALFFGTLSIIPLYLIARKIFNHQIGLFASFLLAVNPTHVRLSADIMSDTTYIFFFLLAVLLGWEIVDRKTLLLIPILGVVVLLAYLTRAEGIGLVLCIVPWLIWTLAIHRKEINLQKSWLVMASVGLVVILLFAYVYFVSKQVGSLQISQHGAILEFIGRNVQPPLEIKTEIVPETGRIREVRSARLLRWKEGGEYHKIFFHMWLEFIKDYYEPFFVFFLLGFFSLTPTNGLALRSVVGVLKPRVASTSGKAEFYLLSPFLLYFLMACLFAYATCYISGRYILSIVVLSFIWGGAGMERFFRYLSMKAGAIVNRPFLFLLPLLLIVLSKDLKIKRQDEVGQKLAGLLIKENLEGRRPVVMGLEKVAFYAQGEYIRFPFGDYDSFLCEAEGKEVDYLVLYREPFCLRRPEIFEQIESRGDFAFVKEWAEPTGQKKHLRIYRYKKSTSISQE